MKVKDLVERNYADTLQLSDSIVVVNRKGNILYSSPNSKELFNNSTDINKAVILDLFEENITLQEALSKGLWDIHINAVIKETGTPVVILITRFYGTGIFPIDYLMSFTMLYININKKNINRINRALNNIIGLLLGISLIVAIVASSSYVVLQIIDQVTYNKKK